jgi:hypothetical protein
MHVLNVGQGIFRRRSFAEKKQNLAQKRSFDS